jgi:hypothetical protein
MSGFTGPGGASSSPRPWNFNYGSTVSVLQQDVVIFNATVGPVTFLPLRNPIFGNTYKFTFSILKRESRGRDLLIDPTSTFPSKPFIEAFSYTIDYLTQVDGQKLFQLLNANLGTLVEIKDYENITWATILITNPEISLVQKDRNNYSVSFEFEYVSNP